MSQIVEQARATQLEFFIPHIQRRFFRWISDEEAYKDLVSATEISDESLHSHAGSKRSNSHVPDGTFERFR
jgi:hypothetical protein